LLNICPVIIDASIDISVEHNINKLNNSFAASDHVQRWIPTLDFILQLNNLPMVNINYKLDTYYLVSCRVYYVKAVYLWRRLNLGLAYETHFGDDDHAFWYSPLTFMSIYKLLSDI